MMADLPKSIDRMPLEQRKPKAGPILDPDEVIAHALNGVTYQWWQAHKNVPPLSETSWIDQQNGGKRAPDFDAFEALANLADRTIAQPDSGLPVNEACFLRLWKGFLIATVELCNIEREKCGVPIETIVAMLPRAMATSSVYAMASVMQEGAPLREIAKVLTEEFRAAAKTAADGLMERA